MTLDGSRISSLEGLAHGAPIPVNRTLIPKQAPALLIHGKDDRVLHYETTLWLLANIPNSRAVLFNRLGTGLDRARRRVQPPGGRLLDPQLKQVASARPRRPAPRRVDSKEKVAPK